MKKMRTLQNCNFFCGKGVAGPLYCAKIAPKWPGLLQNCNPLEVASFLEKVLLGGVARAGTAGLHFCPSLSMALCLKSYPRLAVADPQGDFLFFKVIRTVRRVY